MKAGFKQTEVGVIPEDWNISTLGDIGESFAGLTYKPSDVQSDGVLVLRSSNIQQSRLSFDDCVFVNTLIPEKIMAKNGDILICVRNGSRELIGKCVLLDERVKGMTFGAFMAVFRTPSYRFILHQFQSDVLKRQIHEHLGATINQITNKSLNSFIVPLPPTLAEQEAIASALGDADALIESLERLIAKKRDVKQGAMQELLTARRRLPGFKGKWETKTLGQLATIQRGASPRPIDSPIWFDVNSTVGWVRISDVAPLGMYLHATSQKLSELGIRHSRPVDEGSLIMSICATVGRPVITAIDTCIHDGFVVFDRLQVDIRFLYYLLKSLEDTWSKHGQTGSQMNLNTTLINGTAVILPTTQEEQTAIATVLSDMDSELAALEAKLSKARAIKQGMMQELLTGRIRLK